MKGLVCGVVAGLALVSAAQAEAPPAEAYGRLPAVFDAAISPDGTKVVVARSFPDGAQGFDIVDLANGSTLHAARLGDARRATQQSNLRGVDWADDTHVAFRMSATFSATAALPHYVMTRSNRVNFWRTGIFDLTSQRQYFVTLGNEAWTSWINMYLGPLTSPIEGDPGYGRIQGAIGPSDRSLAVHRVDLSTGQASVLLRGQPDSYYFVLDRNGRPVFRFDVDEHSNRWKFMELGEPRPRLIAERVSEYGAPLSIAGLLPDGRPAGVDKVGGGHETLFAVDRATGAISSIIASERFDVGSPILDPWTHEVVGAELDEGAGQQKYVEPDLTAAYAKLHAVDEHASARFMNWSRDRAKFVVYMERATDAGGYYVFEPATNRLRRLGLRYPDLTAESLGLLQSITYPARDHTRIPAYLTLPPGREARGLPTIVLVHGGPTARDTMSFDWWASFLASRGYAVVQPNFRGSGGYGDEWERAGYREWGRLMQTDVEDAAASLVRSGIADPHRICIVGASYGGYAALAGATLTPDRYKCAAAIAGASDLPMMLAEVERRSGGEDSISSDWWRMLIGDRSADAAQLRAVSPAYQAEHATAPILLIHGANDTVVPISQSRRMQERLRAAGKDVRLVEMPGEDHWLSDAPTRTQMLRELETFLAQNLGSP